MPFIVRIPYYIWIGCSRGRDTSRFAHAFEVDGGNLLGNCSPVHGPTVPSLLLGSPSAATEPGATMDGPVPELDLGPAVLDLPAAPGAGAVVVVRRNIQKESVQAVDVNVTPPLR